jgi:hypothetical protein
MKILILVLSADFPPYNKMIETAMNTWDSLSVSTTLNGETVNAPIETIYYCGKSSKISNDKIIYLPVREGLFNMGHKTLAAFEWALQNKEFDYVARVHSSIYVDKLNLYKKFEDWWMNGIRYNVFSGLKVDANPQWAWGGCGYLASRDVIEKVVQNKDKWDHSKMEDMSLSYVVNDLHIPYMQGMGCSIDKKPDGWLCLCYGTESYKFKNFSEIRWNNGQFLYRVKQDGEREKDLMIMNELFKSMTLNHENKFATTDNG